VNEVLLFLSGILIGLSLSILFFLWVRSWIYDYERQHEREYLEEFGE
jgi:hypothetical protein